MTTPPPTREERLERALRFYAELALYDCPNPETCTARLCILQDKGNIARLALQPAADGEETR